MVFILSLSVYIGLLVLGAGGYHIAWLLWNFPKFNLSNDSTTTLFFQFACWYLGDIIGSILGVVLVTKWQKKKLYVSDLDVRMFEFEMHFEGGTTAVKICPTIRIYSLIFSFHSLIFCIFHSIYAAQ